MSTSAVSTPVRPSLQFTVTIRHDPSLGARVVLRLEPTVFVEPVHTLPEVSAYFERMTTWLEWQPTAPDAARGVDAGALEVIAEQAPGEFA
jgi:hypothetical protein